MTNHQSCHLKLVCKVCATFYYLRRNARKGAVSMQIHDTQTDGSSTVTRDLHLIYGRKFS